jgi:hypothetical protein
LQGNAENSGVEGRAEMPDLRARRAGQVEARVAPRGVMALRPVTTTRRCMVPSFPCIGRRRGKFCDWYREMAIVVARVCGRGLSELLSIKLKMTSPSWQVWEVSTSLRYRLAAELNAFDTSTLRDI